MVFPLLADNWKGDSNKTRGRKPITLVIIRITLTKQDKHFRIEMVKGLATEMETDMLALFIQTHGWGDRTSAQQRENSINNIGLDK